jgi:ABC-type antimicrobial peptide transport system permease subunit
LGRQIQYLGTRPRIIGIAATAKSRTIGEDPRPCLYLPLAGALHGADLINGLTLVVRTNGSPSTYGPEVRRAIRDVAPSIAASGIQTMDAHLQQALFVPRTTAGLFGLAGLSALLISMIGLYGVVSYRVARRTREIGIRLALGARRVQVLGMVVRQGLMLTLIGTAIGLGVALALGKVAGSLLYGVAPTDTLTFVGAPALLVGVSLAACVGPARRAAGLDPVRSVRCE